MQDWLYFISCSQSTPLSRAHPNRGWVWLGWSFRPHQTHSFTHQIMASSEGLWLLNELWRVIHLTFSWSTDQVHFGEVTHAPPRLNTGPCGSAKVTRKGKNQSLLLHSKLESRKETKSTDPPTPKVGGLKRQRDMEMEREKVIQQYRLVKKARTKDRSLR